LGDRPAEQRARWLAAYAGISTYGFMLPYSRRHEYSADHIGLMLMSKAGYDPRAAVHFWNRFSEGKPGSGIANFMSTHPVGARRIENLNGLLSKAQIEYEMSPDRVGVGEVLH
jgi:predicted Zn-dependent protease